MKRNLQLLVAAFVAAVALDSVAFAAEPIKTGVMAPYTGGASRTGEEFKNGALMARDELRAVGMLPVMIDGEMRDIEFVWVDSESSPEKAVKAYQNAVAREGVEIMVNGWHGSVALAVIDIAAQHNMIHFGHLGAPGAISHKIIDNKYRHWFKGMPDPSLLAGGYADPIDHFIKVGIWTPKSKKLAICVEDTDWGRAWGDGFSAAMEGYGWEIVERDVVPFEETEFTSLLAKYKAKGASLVAYSLSANLSSSGFVKQYGAAEYEGLLVADGLGWYPDWYELAGDASNYVVSADSQYIITEKQGDWAKRYEAIYGHAPGLSPAGSSYDYVVMLVKGLNKAGTLKFDPLSDTLLNLEHEGVWHYYSFAKKAGDRAISPYEAQAGPFMQGYFQPMVQRMNGKEFVVWPLEYAQKEFEAPR